jgi:pimeloyl-ACP methyl ester carboxylesterase
MCAKATQRDRSVVASVRNRVFGLVLIASVSVGLAASGVLAQPTPPEQPATGPGSSDYAHATVIQSQYGGTNDSYYLFEPADPTPESAPVIVFLHGFGMVEPTLYGGWIEHIVRRGNIVVWPRYQSGFLSRPQEYETKSLDAVLAAFEELETGEHVKPEREHFALVGHSVGGVLAGNLGAAAVGAGLPEPKAIMIAAASDVIPFMRWRRSFATILASDYEPIPAGALVLGVVAGSDTLAGDWATLLIIAEAIQVPPENREVIQIETDPYGDPALEATHATPLSSDNAGGLIALGVTDAYDYYGYWKWFDGLTDAAFHGINKEYALGNTPEQTYMGQWSDGTPVTPAEVIWPAP